MSACWAQDDFNSFLWNVVMLAMGGSALGEAVKSSGLLLSITQARPTGVCARARVPQLVRCKHARVAFLVCIHHSKQSVLCEG